MKSSERKKKRPFRVRRCIIKYLHWLTRLFERIIKNAKLVGRMESWIRTNSFQIILRGYKIKQFTQRHNLDASSAARSFIFKLNWIISWRDSQLINFNFMSHKFHLPLQHTIHERHLSSQRLQIYDSLSKLMSCFPWRLCQWEEMTFLSMHFHHINRQYNSTFQDTFYSTRLFKQRENVSEA